MREPIIIGNKSYKYKKDALAYYQKILNSYDFGECVNEEHLDDLIDLINYNISLYSNETPDKTDVEEANIREEIATAEEVPDSSEEEVFIEDIRIAKVQYDSKCFEVVYTDSTTCLMSLFVMFACGISKLR